MGRVARNIDIRRLELLKSVIDDTKYQERAMMGIADVLTHVLFEDDDTVKAKKRSSRNNAKNQKSSG